jgi:pimeloyl-ACP methyl ester carboxylesterase
MGRMVEVADTRLYIEERGELSAFPLLVFHGGPGLDHTMFGDHLDALTEEGRYRLVLVDDRAYGRSDRMPWRETWMLGRMAQHVSDLAACLGVSGRYATLGHSYGAFVVLQHALDHPGEPRGTIVSAGIAAARWLEEVDRPPTAFEPAELREQAMLSWARETEIQTEDEAAALLADQMPFHFQEPRGAALGGVPAPDRRGRPLQARHYPPFPSGTAARSTSKTGSQGYRIRCWCSWAATTERARSVRRWTWREAAGRRTRRVRELRAHSLRRGAGPLPRGGPPVPRPHHRLSRRAGLQMR